MASRYTITCLFWFVCLVLFVYLFVCMLVRFCFCLFLFTFRLNSTKTTTTIKRWRFQFDENVMFQMLDEEYGAFLLLLFTISSWLQGFSFSTLNQFYDYHHCGLSFCFSLSLKRYIIYIHHFIMYMYFASKKKLLIQYTDFDRFWRFS